MTDDFRHIKELVKDMRQGEDAEYNRRIAARTVLELREQIAALESREVCTVAHENVETCGYCQRDAAEAVVKDLCDAWMGMKDIAGPMGRARAYLGQRLAATTPASQP